MTVGSGGFFETLLDFYALEIGHTGSFLGRYFSGSLLCTLTVGSGGFFEILLDFYALEIVRTGSFLALETAFHDPCWLLLRMVSGLLVIWRR